MSIYQRMMMGPLEVSGKLSGRIWVKQDYTLEEVRERDKYLKDELAKAEGDEAIKIQEVIDATWKTFNHNARML